jgi:peptide/nickel transport system permease protein
MTAPGVLAAPSAVPVPVRAARRRPRVSTVVAAGMLLLVLAVAVVVPLLPLYDPFAQDLGASLAKPFASSSHLLGTDELGRDQLSRVSLAIRTSLLIVVSALALNLVVGVLLGLLAGYVGRSVDTVIMFVADVQLSIPLLILLVSVVAVIGPSGTTLAVVIGLCYWVGYARVSRVVAASLREREFVLASRTHGAGTTWVLRKHVLPQVLPQLVILASFDLGVLAIIEASLSYLGLGIQAPTPSIGGMINAGQAYLEQDPWLTLVPGVVIFLLVGGVQVLSQRLTAEGESGPASTWAL